MPYIGNPAVDRFTATKAASVYSGDGSTVAFTLENSVGADEDILVSVDGVVQEPSVAYAVSSGTTLTFTAAPSSNSGNNIFVYYLFTTIGTVTHPATSALSATSGTFSTTLAVTGETTLSTHLNMGDNDKIKIGASDDLEIYHDASNSYIDESGTGSLRIRSNRLRLEKHTGENMIECLEDGAVELYHNGTKRFETTATGVTAPGIISSSVGKSHIGEFTGNGTIAANQASIIQLQNCFSSAYSIYRIVGELGGDQSAEDVGKLRFLTSGTTSHDSGYYWGNLGIDDAGNRQLAADANQASFQWSKNLASSVSVHVDMHIYFGGIGGRIGILGRATYHDQGSDRGFMDFGGQSEGITSATGIEFFCTDGGNLAGYNFSVYGYRTQQGATGKMTGSYS